MKTLYIALVLVSLTAFFIHVSNAVFTGVCQGCQSVGCCMSTMRRKVESEEGLRKVLCIVLCNVFQ